MVRVSKQVRSTKETQIEVTVDLDGEGSYEVETGVPFFDHMLCQIARHSGMDLMIRATGDIEVDTHHLVEDVGITLGAALSEAFGDKSGIERYGFSSVPMDETLVQVSLDISGRPYLHYAVELPTQMPLGTPGFDPQLAEEFFRALTTLSNFTLHVELVRGRNLHHIMEGVFKAFARALRSAKAVSGGDVPSTKGIL